MKNNLWSIIFVCLLLTSCTSSVQKIGPLGGDAWVENSYYDVVTGEILAVDDSCVYYIYEESVYKAPLTKTRKIYIRGYSLLSEKLISVTPLMLFNTAIILSEGTSEYNGILRAFPLFSAIVTVISIVIGNPEVEFKPPLTDRQLEKLKLYCRYPQGLDHLQWNEVLMSYGQMDFKTVVAKYEH